MRHVWLTGIAVILALQSTPVHNEVLQGVQVAAHSQDAIDLVAAQRALAEALAAQHAAEAAAKKVETLLTEVRAERAAAEKAAATALMARREIEKFGTSDNKFSKAKLFGLAAITGLAVTGTVLGSIALARGGNHRNNDNVNQFAIVQSIRNLQRKPACRSAWCRRDRTSRSTRTNRATRTTRTTRTAGIITVRKIALEEHFSGPGFEKYLDAVRDGFDPSFLSAVEKLLPEFEEKRLAAMDMAGIEISVLSQTAPGVQFEKDGQVAQKAARASNDFLARQISRHADRYRGFACLALQDAHAAAEELERCVTEHQFVGALVNGHTDGIYLDDRRYWPFWEKVQQLDVPFYLHPGNPFDHPRMYEGRPELDGATWSWTCETATHALRLVFGGVFDNFPGLRVILGHMGETLPFMLWRLDSRIAITPFAKRMKKPPSQIIREHFVITTSGVCANGPLLCSLAEMGEDSVMFSVDYPYEDTETAVNFIEQAPLSTAVREKVCFRTAERVLKLLPDRA